MSSGTRSAALPAWIGIDIGTSGCRAIAIDETGRELAGARVELAEPLKPAPGCCEQDPDLWWTAVMTCLKRLGADLDGRHPIAVCVDATSATLLLTTRTGTPFGSALMYNDRRAVDEAALIDRVAPRESPARGPSSSLAKLLHLHRSLEHAGNVLAQHQADWILGRMTGRYGVSDWNNALKLGYDPERLCWPEWVTRLVPEDVGLPDVLAPGETISILADEIADELGWPATTRVLAGTTDSTAAVIATGASTPGDAVTCLGSTLVLKIVSDRPVTAAAYGIYSHRFGDLWLVGGASNSGGAVLRQHFTDDEIAALSLAINPEQASGLDYYPLPAKGERFPRNDPALAPLLSPRPSDPTTFLHGLFEGIARIEAEGYARLAELGAPRPKRILGIGGGAANPTWTRLRARILGVDVVAADHQDAAYGAALLALGQQFPSAA